MRDGEDDGADTHRPAEDETGRERDQLDAGANDPEPLVRAGTDDDHQGVTRAGAHPRAEVERRRDPVDRHRNHEQRDPDAEGVVGEAVDRADRRQRLDERPDEHGVRDRGEPDRRAEPPCDRHHDDADDDVRRPERERRVLGDALMEHVPRRQPEARLQLADDREREEEEADEQRDPPREEPAANPRRTVHRGLR